MYSIFHKEIVSRIEKICDANYNKINELREKIIAAGKMIDKLKQ